MADIGYQDGIEAFEQWFRKFSTWIDAFNGWVDAGLVGKPPKAPRIPLEGPNFDPANPETWPWPVKYFDNTMRKLKDSHDAANDTTPPPKPPDPPPATYKLVAPRVAYKAGSSDARYCLWMGAEGGTLRPGVVKNPDGTFSDEAPARYDSNGLSLGGRTDGSASDGITSALEIDGRPYCSLPMTGDPTLNTGSWRI